MGEISKGADCFVSITTRLRKQILRRISTPATRLTETPICEGISECELTRIHGAPTNERLGRINGSVSPLS
jgi:hypothetical protein